MSVDGVPEPGPRPEEFEFPFVAAGVALAAIEEAVSELQAAVSVHEDAVVTARVDFEGETRHSFDEGFSDLLSRIGAGIRQLQAQREDLSDDITEARRRQEASIDATADWGQAVQRYREAQAAQLTQP